MTDAFSNIQLIHTKAFTVKVHTCRPFIYRLCAPLYSIYRISLFFSFSQTVSNPCQTQTFLSKNRGVDSHGTSINRRPWSRLFSGLFCLELLFSCHVQITAMADSAGLKLQTDVGFCACAHNYIT